MTQPTNPETPVLVLRSCGAGFTAHGGFVWPSAIGAKVRPERWDPTPNCGDGLHGFLHGEGDGGLADWSETAEWLVFECAPSDVVALDGKVKCGPEVTIAHVGQGATAFERRLDAIAFLVSRGQCGAGCIGRMLTGGDGSTLTGGYGSTLTGGHRSTLLLKWWDDSRGQYRRKMVTVGDDDVAAGVAYRLTDAGVLTPA